MIQSNSYLQLLPCCRIVKGNQKDAIYDLQREEYQLIPHTLTQILEESKVLTYGELKAKYAEDEDILDDYCDFLIKNEFVAIDATHLDMMEIESDVQTPSVITNAILDFDQYSNYNLRSVIEELDELRCNYVELRFFSEVAYHELIEILSIFDGTSIRGVELLLPYNKSFNLKQILKIHLNFPRVRKFTLHRSPAQSESIFLHDEICIIFTSESFIDETCCGIVNQWYMLPKTDLFLESQHYNTCLNRKIGIDKRGNIKNCPSSLRIFGKVGEKKLKDVVELLEFQYYWNIKKDEIKVCKDCELRHMCQDCRVYIKDPEDPYSKPSKCMYNPYL